MQKQLLGALDRYPVFTIRDIENILDKKRAYAYLVAYRLKKTGVIREIEKGKYTLENDPFLIASWIVWPSYISGFAALNYHKLTEQLPFTIHVVTTRKRKKKIIRFMNTGIEFLKIKKEAFFGYRRVIHHKKEVFIAEPEKAIVDGLATKKMSFSEAIDIYKNNRKKISKKKLFSYAGVFRGIAGRLKVALDD